MESVLQSSISWADDDYWMLWDKVIDWGDSTPDEIWEKLGKGFFFFFLEGCYAAAMNVCPVWTFTD